MCVTRDPEEVKSATSYCVSSRSPSDKRVVKETPRDEIFNFVFQTQI